MYEKLMFLWRHLAQVGVGAVAAWLVGRGVGVDPAAATAVEAAVFGLGVWAYGVAVRWLETRPGDTIAAKAARAVARLLMLGAPPMTPSRTASSNWSRVSNSAVVCVFVMQ